MPQQDMDWDTFVSIVDQIPAGEIVNLQGEGEPTLWSHWWRGVEYVAERGLVPYMITNASRVDAELIAKFFPTIGITIDSLSASESEEIGRHNLPKVLANVAELSKLMPDRITIHTVTVGKGADRIIKWAVENNCKFRLHGLERKDDYASTYPIQIVPRQTKPRLNTGFQCQYLQSGTYYYWTVTGKRLPCCYIKGDPHSFDSDVALQEMSQNTVPKHCSGCNFLR